MDVLWQSDLRTQPHRNLFPLVGSNIYISIRISHLQIKALRRRTCMFVFPISYNCEDSLWIKEGDKVKKKENWHVKREGEGDGDRRTKNIYTYLYCCPSPNSNHKYVMW